jgi:hypothetical protein
MFETLPPETVALRILLGDLHDDLEERVGRLRLLMALEYDFGAGRGLMLEGGTTAQAAYYETRQSWVVGNFLAVVLLSQSLLENVLAAHVGMEALSAEIQGREVVSPTERPTLQKTIKGCKAIGLLTDEDERDLLRLAELRNALSHFRTVGHETNLDRRSINERRSAHSILEDDARFAITVFVRMLAKSQFRFQPDP